MTEISEHGDGMRPFQLLRDGRTEEALKLFRELHERQVWPGRTRGLGEALMWTGRYGLAVDLFEESIEINTKFRMRSENDYALLGAAQWCLGNRQSAVKSWRTGIKAPYAIAGVKVQTPMLLIAASVIDPELQTRPEAEAILRSKLFHRTTGERSEHWPGSLGKFVLGGCPKEVMAAYWVRTTRLYEVVLEADRPWLTDFYETVLDFGAGKMTSGEFQVRIREGVNESRFLDWPLNNWYTLTGLPEFYVARALACSDSPATRNLLL